MGTVITVDVRDADLPESALDAVFAWFHDVDETFSTFRTDSEISRLSRGELREHQCSPTCERSSPSARRSDCAAREASTSDGWRDRPPRLVKGWSVDRASTMLEVAGARNFFIDAGGDVVVRGRPEPGRTWRLGIRHPEQTDRVAAVLAIRDVAVATSGTYERGAHIVDPRSGLPPSGS